MANVLTPTQQNILAAAAGNPAMLEFLESIYNTVRATQQVTNTSGKGVPAQAQASVSFLEGNYIVQITNPGASTPLSQIQRAQQTQNANQATTLEPVTAILHQIRCATSPSFGVNDSVQTFGGDTGSTQTYWTLGGLGSGNFYFQVRSSYDGTDWNQWKNANGGQSITSFPQEVTLESATNMDWAVLTLPGDQLLAVGEGFAADGGTFTLPENLFTSAMMALAGPNGFTDTGRHMNDMPKCDVAVVVPQDTSGTVGIPDYPTVVNVKYGDDAFPQNLWSGSANLFAIVFDPAGKNVTRYIGPDGLSSWVVFTLPGGAQFAIGQGRAVHGVNIWVPEQLPWITGGGSMLSICSPHGSEADGHSAHGIRACGLTGLTAAMQYADADVGGNVWPGNANWLAVAWTPGLKTVAVTGGTFVVINLGGGNQIAFGGGVTASGAVFGLPAGFTASQMLSISTPAGFGGSGDNVAHGVAQCEIIGTAPILFYRDGSGNSWSGPSNWLAFAWAKNAAATGGAVVKIDPLTATIEPGGLQAFTATVTGASGGVVWSVDGIVGGNVDVGTIDPDGNYTAPAVTGDHRITASSATVPTASDSAIVSVIDPSQSIQGITVTQD